MKIGDIVEAKNDSRIFGEVTAIDDWDRATVKLNVSGVEVLVAICDLEVIGEAKWDGLCT